MTGQLSFRQFSISRKFLSYLRQLLPGYNCPASNRRHYCWILFQAKLDD